MSNINDLRDKIEKFEKRIGYIYKNKDHMILAMTHSSYANERKGEKLRSNERLEFLGDSILNLAISERIYRDYTDLEEGELTRVRANIVCEHSLMECANNINIGEFLLLGKGEEQTGGRSRVSILSDAFEAVIGSIFIDGGLQNAKFFIYNQMHNLIDDAVNGLIFMDYKTQLQETIQRNNEKKIIYEVVDEKGPDHNKLFIIQVKIGNDIMGEGEGRTKKEAEQNAARIALGKLK